METNATINVIVQAITAISERMNENASHISRVCEDSQTVASQTHQAVEMLDQTVVAMEEVAKDASENQTHLEEGIVSRIESINQVSSSNARSVEEIASAAQHLSRLSEKLSQTLAQFKTA